MNSLRSMSTQFVRRSGACVGLLSVACLGATVARVSATQFPTTHLVADIAVGDLNGDGIEDIVTCGSSATSSTVDVLLGNGDGTFQGAIPTRVAPNPGAVALGDFNSDGKLDVVAASFGTPDAPGKTVNVLLGNGDGTFAKGQNLVLNATPNSIAVTDLNADGIPDLVVGDAVGFVALLGDGTGGFVLTAAVGSGDSFPGAITTGDVNGDGKIDVLQANRNGASVVALGNGDGTFAVPSPAAPGGLSRPMLVGDLNGDGLTDLIAVNGRYPTNWNVYLNQGNSTFTFAFGSGGAAVHDFAAGDFNGDGKIDLVFSFGGDTRLQSDLGNGDGSFQVNINAGRSAGDVLAVGDFNGDGVLDLAGGSMTSPRVIVEYGNGDGTFDSIF